MKSSGTEPDPLAASTSCAPRAALAELAATLSFAWLSGYRVRDQLASARARRRSPTSLDDGALAGLADAASVGHRKTRRPEKSPRGASRFSSLITSA